MFLWSDTVNVCCDSDSEGRSVCCCPPQQVGAGVCTRKILWSYQLVSFSDHLACKFNWNHTSDWFRWFCQRLLWSFSSEMPSTLHVFVLKEAAFGNVLQSRPICQCEGSNTAMTAWGKRQMSWKKQVLLVLQAFVMDLLPFGRFCLRLSLRAFQWQVGFQSFMLLWWNFSFTLNYFTTDPSGLVCVPWKCPRLFSSL